MQASTSGALTFEQLKRLSGHVDTVSVGRDSPESDILEADDVKTHADLGEIAGDTNKTDTTASSPPRVSRATRVAASAAIRGAAQAWEVEADAVGRGLRQRRVQPPPRPRAPQQCDSDTDDGSTAAMHQQLHALETELADLKASINTHPDVDHASSAAKGQLLHLSSTVDGHEHDWHSESPSERDSVVVVRSTCSSVCRVSSVVCAVHECTNTPLIATKFSGRGYSSRSIETKLPSAAKEGSQPKKSSEWKQDKQYQHAPSRRRKQRQSQTPPGKKWDGSSGDADNSWAEHPPSSRWLHFCCHSSDTCR